MNSNKLSWRWRGYWLAHARRVLSVVVHLPLCLFGQHREADGLFHEFMDDYGEWDSYKCYHCRYCGAAIDRGRCIERGDVTTTNGYVFHAVRRGRGQDD